MNLQALFHISEIPYAYGVDDETLFIKLRVAAGDVKNATLHYKERYDSSDEFTSIPMEKISSTSLFDFYGSNVQVKEGRLRYFFELEDVEGKKVYLNEKGILEAAPKSTGQFQYPYVHKEEIYKPLLWTRDAIVYQIFPDRFCNGDRSNDPQQTKHWGAEVDSNSFFGGDIRGIINHLDYLGDLGVTLIYLTPIFKSTSNHKYNTTDYFEIDEHFGSKDDLRELVSACHDRGMRLVLDAVFNHSGYDFFAFEDVRKNGHNSQFADWFYINNDDEKSFNYKTFANDIKDMPKLNLSNPETRKYFLKVAQYWIDEFDIDGWRLDVADEVVHSFWKEMRTGVKALKEDAILIGEVMHEGKLFLKGDEFDSLMNYPFREACLDFFAYGNIDSQAFVDRIILRKEGLLKHINSQMLNLLDSHDTPRILTVCDGSVNKVVLATVFQFTTEGIPYIYYGDEVGLSGGEDPQCRKCMAWNQEDQNLALLNHYKKLIAIRKHNRALTFGDFSVVYAKDKALAYKRSEDDDEILVLINNSSQKHFFDLEVTGEFVDLYSNEQVTFNNGLELDSMSFRIISMKKC